MSFVKFNLYILGIFIGAVALQFVFMRVGGWFRSAERKVGTYRAGGGQGKSSKLPMTGGPAMIVAALAGGWLAMSGSGAWPVAVAVAGFGAVGLLDDIGKYRGRGLPQSAKTIGCLLVAAIVAWLLAVAGGAEWGAAQVARWAVSTAFLFCFAVAADFSDGIDGLAGGLGLVASFAMLLAAVAARRFGAGAWAVSFVVILAFYVFNLPSAWTSRGSIPRRAHVYVGDSGALALGGGMAAAALWMHLGWVFVLAAAVWIIEGFSSAWQAELLVKRVYRKAGQVERYGAAYAPHTEFPLPLLAAPIHHHFEVAGWGRLEVVRLLYGVAVICGLAAVIGALAGTWLVIGYALAGAALVGLWSLAGAFRSCYLAVGSGGNLSMNSGLPFRLRSRRYHKVVQATQLAAENLTPNERLWLYRPMPRPDAMEILVRLLLAHGKVDEATKITTTLPASMRTVRLGDVLPETENA